MNGGLMVYCFASVLVASICKGIVGFGDPLISGPLLSMALPNRVITPGQVPVSLLLNSKMVWQNRRHFSWRLVLPVSVFVLLGILPGVFLLRYGSPAILKLGLGAVIILSGIEMLTRESAKKRKPNPVVWSAVSFLSGLTAGLFGINLLVLAYLHRVSENREGFRSNVCFVFLLECAFRLAVYLWNGMYTRECLMLTLAALPGAFLGIAIGTRLDRHISDRTADRLVIFVFIAGGVSTVVKALLELF